MDTDILIVSGLPRSGTSLMMAMLDRGGIPVLTDELRTADTDNPRGYYELERVKQTKQDSSWLSEARGRAVKVISSLLYDLPPSENYRVLFMQRDLNEVLTSQEKMLQRRGQPLAPRDKMRSSFTIHLERLFEWIPHQPHIRLLPVNYNQLMSDAESIVSCIAQFIGQDVDADRMCSAVDPSLYRNRNPVG